MKILLRIKNHIFHTKIFLKKLELDVTLFNKNTVYGISVCRISFLYQFKILEITRRSICYFLQRENSIYDFYCKEKLSYTLATKILNSKNSIRESTRINKN